MGHFQCTGTVNHQRNNKRKLKQQKQKTLNVKNIEYKEHSHHVITARWKRRRAESDAGLPDCMNKLAKLLTMLFVFHCICLLFFCFFVFLFF